MKPQEREVEGFFQLKGAFKFMELLKCSFPGIATREADFVGLEVEMQSWHFKKNLR